MTIAGHDFDPITNRCTLMRSDGNLCNMHWHTIRNVTEADVGQMGIAHSQDLRTNEYQQIVAQRDAEDAALERAMKG